MASTTTTGIYVSAADLAGLEAQARHLVFRPPRPNHNLLAGRHGSRVRGRGLDFEELRQYLPGDDVRTIDWKVTARSRRPFVRVYTEEKDRPVTLVVDQRINMFFGSARALKSVTAAEAAALCGWRAIADGDRVGSLLFDDTNVVEQRPQRDRGSMLRWLGTLARMNQALTADSPARRNGGQLDRALEAAVRVAQHDHLVIVCTDCDGHGERSEDLLRQLAIRNDVVLLLVHDPFFSKLPESGALVVTDGGLQVELRMASGRIRRSISEGADARLARQLNWQRELGIVVVPISAAEETPAQLRHLMGSGAPRVRARGGRA
jgi:uncharacterized protein (DUF58 family)